MKGICIRIALAGLLAAGGFISGAVWDSRRHQTPDTRDVTTVQKSGAPITVSGWKTDGKSFSFTSYSKGAGVAETTAPKSIIPEAKAYMERVHQVNGFCGALVYDRRTDPFVGCEYLYRYLNFSAGGGMLVSSHGVFGVYGKAGLML